MRGYFVVVKIENNLTIYGGACVSQSVSQSVSVKSAMRMTTKWHGMT